MYFPLFQKYNRDFPKEYRFGVPIDSYYLPTWREFKEGDIWERNEYTYRKIRRLTGVVVIKGMGFSLQTIVKPYRKFNFDTYKYDRDSQYFPTFINFMASFVGETDKEITCRCCKKKVKEVSFRYITKGFCKKCLVGYYFFDYYSSNYYEHLDYCKLNKYHRYSVAPLYSTLMAQPIQLAIFNKKSDYRRYLSRSIIDFVRSVEGFSEFRSIYPFYENKDLNLEESYVIELLKSILIDTLRVEIGLYYKRRYVNKATLNFVRMINNYGWQREFDKFLVDVDDFIRFNNTTWFDSCKGLDRFGREFDIKSYEIVIGLRGKKELKRQDIGDIWQKFAKNASKIMKTDTLITIGECYGV